ncbi:ATP-binding protein [Pseudoalteromonas sp. SSDWG2]|uniref:ATP-binding protein n=1 Tax=Pseudoalteromonas sp. SSDWG2 TaxID=3139391 RepID=UPI003BA95A8A
MSERKFSTSLFRTIMWLSILPMLIVIVFFASQFYVSSLEQAQQSLSWRVKNDALALRQQLYQSTIDNERLANSKAIAQLPVRILYSQFALTQMQAYVTTHVHANAALVIDNEGFIVEGYPLNALNIPVPITTGIVEAVNQTQDSLYFVITMADVINKTSKQINYIAIASPLNLEQESLSTPYRNTGVLLSIQPLSGLLGSLFDIDQSFEASAANTYEAVLGNEMHEALGEGGIKTSLNALSRIVSVLHEGKEQPLNLRITEPTMPHLEALKNSVVFAGALLFVLAVLAALFAKWLVAKLNKPLQDITYLSQQYAQGDYDFKGEAFSYSEFEHISKDLQSMAMTIEKQIDSLQQEKQKAQASERSKSLFLANMSHEIRTPMNGIFGYVQLLEKTQLKANQMEFARQIRVCTQMLLTVINDVLDFSKIEANKVVLEQRPCDLTLMLKDVMSLFEPTCAGKGIKCTICISDDKPICVLTDEVRLKQVLINLISNAVKFTAEGGIELALDYRLSGNQCVCQFTVTDTGVGIAKEKQSQLFQPFVQAQDSTTREFGGTGLGLSICKRLVELMGGAITLQSEVNKGSSFIINLDFPRCEDIPLEQEEHLDLPLPQQFLDSRVLVAEDNPINQYVIETFLEELGAEVYIVDNGKLAVEAVAQQGFDIILMDVQMPVMDGLSAAQAICAQYPSHPPIIAVSANAMSQDVEQARAAGMQDHLAKPIEFNELVKILNKWLQKGSAAPIEKHRLSH